MAASPPDLPAQPTDDAWSELDRSFFASAPPDVPEPPPEPMRFDDLEPLAPPPPPLWQARLSRAWRRTGPARLMLRDALHEAYRRGAPAAARTWRRSIALSRTARARWATLLKRAAVLLKRAAPALAALRLGARNHRFVAAGAVALVVVMGISAVVVASRGAGRPVAAVPPAPVAGGARATYAAAAPAADAPAPVAMSEAALAAPGAPDTIAPRPALPARHKRKHAQHPARQAVRVKPARSAPAR